MISILKDKSQLLNNYIVSNSTNPEWPHSQGNCLVCLRLQGRLSAHAASIYIVKDELRGYCPWGWELTANQFYLPSQTPLTVARCGRLQLGVTHWATSVVLLQVVDIWHHKQWWSILLWGTPGQMRLYLFFTVIMFTKVIFWWKFSQIWIFLVFMQTHWLPVGSENALKLLTSVN